MNNTTDTSQKKNDFLPDIFGLKTTAGCQVKVDNVKTASHLLAGLSLLIFLLSPFISSLIANVTQPQDGSGAAWGIGGVVNGILSWGIATVAGAILGYMSTRIRRTPLAITSCLLNALIAIPFLFLCLYALLHMLG